MLRLLIGFCAMASLSACDWIPRGAGLQSEVLAVAIDDDPNAPPDFAVELVTVSNVATFLRWPAADGAHFHWIDRVDQPNTRSIKAGDTLRITIWATENDGLMTGPGQRNVTLPDTRVSSSGRIFLPYIGDFRVSGQSPDRARANIEQAYTSVQPSAQVQLEMIEGRAQEVSLVGGVATPGSFALPDNDFTILQLIADRGGIDESLTNPQVRLQRNGRMFGISADRLFNSPNLDTTLVGGDKIFVQDDDRTFLSLGAAGTEAVHPFPTDTVTALEALSIIGGVTDNRANPKGILILRQYPLANITTDRSGPDHPRTVFTLDLTTADGLFSADQFEIQSGDLIYVTESPITAAQSIFGLLGSVIGLNNAVN
jgi:polysaccharide export outer membrane protein